ncbi:hypothetical protein E2P81_ATG06957 [Venturia nashicola]|nr:hypothetical protein E2P81_ATG06957 [Venturia nashicola]
MRGLVLTFLLPTVVFAQSRGEPHDPVNGPRPMIVGGPRFGGGGVAMIGPPVAAGMLPIGGGRNSPGMTRFGGGGGGRGGGDIMERATIKKRSVKPDAFPGIQRARIFGEDTST